MARRRRPGVDSRSPHSGARKPPTRGTRPSGARGTRRSSPSGSPGRKAATTRSSPTDSSECGMAGACTTSLTHPPSRCGTCSRAAAADSRAEGSGRQSRRRRRAQFEGCATPARLGAADPDRRGRASHRSAALTLARGAPRSARPRCDPTVPRYARSRRRAYAPAYNPHRRSGDYGRGGRAAPHAARARVRHPPVASDRAAAERRRTLPNEC